MSKEVKEELSIRLLKPHEIDCRVATVTAKGFSLLLYKDARCDMKILDETFGVFGWQREHVVINDNLFCNIKIYDKETQQWITKQDVGVESYTEKQKGEASDSFKRAGFNVGIGRELYTAPFIWIGDTSRIYDTGRKNGNKKVYSVNKYDKFFVSKIKYNENREITELTIIDNKGEMVYNNKQKTTPKKQQIKNEIPISDIMVEEIIRLIDSNVDKAKELLKPYGVSKLDKLSYNQGKEILDKLK